MPFSKERWTRPWRPRLRQLPHAVKNRTTVRCIRTGTPVGSYTCEDVGDRPPDRLPCAWAGATPFGRTGCPIWGVAPAQALNPTHRPGGTVDPCASFGSHCGSAPRTIESGLGNGVENASRATFLRYRGHRGPTFDGVKEVVPIRQHAQFPLRTAVHGGRLVINGLRPSARAVSLPRLKQLLVALALKPAQFCSQRDQICRAQVLILRRFVPAAGPALNMPGGCWASGAPARPPGARSSR